MGIRNRSIGQFNQGGFIGFNTEGNLTRGGNNYAPKIRNNDLLGRVPTEEFGH